jgi:thymidylate synthase
MIVYHPTYDAKKMFGQPCMLAIDFKPRNGDLYVNATFRSQRITKSGYADYTALIKMGEYLAKTANMKLKRVTNIAHSLHLGGKENNELENTKKILNYFKNKF